MHGGLDRGWGGKGTRAGSGGERGKYLAVNWLFGEAGKVVTFVGQFSLDSARDTPTIIRH